MAGGWIKWVVGLASKREVRLIASRCNRDRYEIAGRLMALWEWLDENLSAAEFDEETGDATVEMGEGWAREVDDIVGLHGMAEAMASTSVRWIIPSSDNGLITFPNLGRHNGKTAKTRAMEASKKGRQRRDKCPDDNGTTSGTEKRREEKKEQDQNLSSSAGADDLHVKREQRLKAIALEAIAAYNATLARPHGTLAAVRSTVGLDTRIANVRRCVKVASDICQATYGSQTITPEFWTHYFAAVKADPFKSGEQGGGQGHENWKPDFEYLTRPKTMLQVYDRAESEAA